MVISILREFVSNHRHPLPDVVSEEIFTPTLLHLLIEVSLQDSEIDVANQREIMRSQAGMSWNYKSSIEHIQKRFEINYQLYERYTLSFKKASDIPLHDVGYLQALGLMLLNADRANDIRFLNTGLKLVDYINRSISSSDPSNLRVRKQLETEAIALLNRMAC